MKTETLEQMLSRHEGRKTVPYKCSAGHWTVGVGHNMDANPLPDDMALYLMHHGEITEAMVDELLDQDIKTAVADCRRLYEGFDTFSEGRRNALIDFVFNVGEGTARDFVMTRSAIELGNWDRAAKELQDSRWYKQVGNRGREIVQMIKEA
jgi:lysozyme